jgi:glycerol kinase
MQFQADVLSVSVERSAVNETTALGAAFLAGLAVGLWENKEEVAGLRQSERVFHGQMDEHRRVSLYQGWQAAVKAARAFRQV